MKTRIERIGGKEVLLSQPYRPDTTRISEMVGREGEMKMITASWMGGRYSLPLSPLLLGEPGIGKNRLVYEMARLTGKDLYIFQGHEDVTSEDLACTVRFSDDPGKKMDYVLSPLVTAMYRGGICFIDEIAKIRPRALALLVSVLDERRYIDSTLLGERVHAHEGFRFIAATNTADLDGNALPEFILSRMRPVITVGPPSKTQINKIIQSQFPDLDEILKTPLEVFWDLWKGKSADTPPTPRDALHLFTLALSLADYDCATSGQPDSSAGKLPACISYDHLHALDIEPLHIEKAFNQLFLQKGAISQ